MLIPFLFPALMVLLNLAIPPLRRLLRYKPYFQLITFLFLFSIALISTQSPAYAGFLTTAESFAKTSFPGTDVVLGFVFNGLRLVAIVAFAVTSLKALNANRSGDSDWMEMTKPPIVILILVFGSDQIVALITT